MIIVPAKWEEDPEICSIAVQSKYTKDFSRILFVRQAIEEHYQKEHVGVAVDKNKIIGFVLVNHLKRKPYSSIYYMGVDKENKMGGVGRALVKWALNSSPWKALQLICEEANVEGSRFYPAVGFKEIEKGTVGKGRVYTRFELKNDT